MAQPLDLSGFAQIVQMLGQNQSNAVIEAMRPRSKIVRRDISGNVMNDDRPAPRGLAAWYANNPQVAPPGAPAPMQGDPGLSIDALQTGPPTSAMNPQAANPMQSSPFMQMLQMLGGIFMPPMAQSTVNPNSRPAQSNPQGDAMMRKPENQLPPGFAMPQMQRQTLQLPRRSY